MNKTIYKLDSAGRLRFLTIRTEGAELIQESGLLNSASPVEHRSACTPKNVGRSNETTAEQQAELEGESTYTEKIKEGYSTTVAAAESNVIVLPMLAKEYKKEAHKIDWSKPVYVQPKLDGMRTLTNDIRMISRKGNVIDTMDHIMASMYPKMPIIDGELYTHGKNFQENMRIIKKDRGEETKQVKLHVYDLVSKLPFMERYKILGNAIKGMKDVELVPTYSVTSEEEMKIYHKKFLAEGYEGTIIRHSAAGYAINHRDTQLLKYKDFMDIACKVIDVVPSDKNPLQGVVECELMIQEAPAKTFRCGMKFSHAEREEILKNKDKYIGQTAEVRFFEYSEDGIPRFPVCHGFRLDV